MLSLLAVLHQHKIAASPSFSHSASFYYENTANKVKLLFYSNSTFAEVRI